MSLTSIEFLVFVIVAVVGYYIIPKRCQWMWLLLFSYIYYASAGIQYLGFILYTTLVTYGTALVIHRIDQTDEAHKKRCEAKKEGRVNTCPSICVWSVRRIEVYEFYCTEY